MLKHAAYLGIFVLMSFSTQNQAHAQNGSWQPQDRYEPPSSPRPHQVSPWSRTFYSYYKASMGISSIGTNRDSSGEIAAEGSSVLPINLAYGFTGGNAAFEAEIGFSNNDFEFKPSDISDDHGFGDISSSKLMFNGFYKTTGAGSNLYIGGGIGFVSVSIDGVEQEMTGSSLATQFIVGGEIRTTEKSGFFVEFKHLKSVGLEIENDFVETDYNFKETSLNVGLKLYF